MAVFLFFICFAASTAGAIAGFGGGVIMKPVVDALGLLPVASVSFLSGCTVLAMSAVSLLRSRGSGVKLEFRTSTPLAIGAALGGVAGKGLFQLLLESTGQDSLLGLIQSACLLLVTLFVFAYILKKKSLKAYHTKGVFLSGMIGLALGLPSSFLGIGGGPYNVAALFLFYSMDGKTAAKNSIYVILFSQTASLVATVCTGTVPEFAWPVLAWMAAGGIGGALLGAGCSRRLTAEAIERLLRVLLVTVILIDAGNVVRFFLETQ